MLALLNVRATDRPCKACGMAIEPGQLWVVDDGPLHIGCTDYTEPDLCPTWRCDQLAGHDGPCTWRR